MATRRTSSCFLLFLCFSIPAALIQARLDDSSRSSERSVDSGVVDFTASLESTIVAIRKVTYIVSKFTNAFGDFRLSNAVADCLDLLDFSSEELGWTLSATRSPNGQENGSGATSSDLRTWLGAALGNQDTCVDGFEGTNSFVEGVVTSSVSSITSLVRSILTTLPSSSSSSFSDTKKKERKLGDFVPFPDWVKPKDRKLLAGGGGLAADVTVAKDGSGNYTRVMDAVLAAPDNSTRRYVIHVKKGVYFENVEIKKKKWNLMVVGDGMDVTVISGNRSVVDGWTTFRSATFAASGRGFIARDMTFENTAGPQKHQAVALRSDSDLSAFYRCAVRGFQDTLYAHSLRQFYRECVITGTVDFIFGDGAVVFQNCQILARKGLPDQKNTVTAQGRKESIQPTGFTIQFSNISADTDLKVAANSTTNSTVSTYLGRPWKPYSRTVIMQSYIDSTIRQEGWLEWNGSFALDTLYYAEYMNYGPAAETRARVKWPGFHVLNESTQATNFTVAQFIEGTVWLPSTGVKYTAGLSV